MITTNEDMYKISQETKIKLSQTLSTLFELQTDIQFSWITLCGIPLKVTVQDAQKEE